MAVSRQPSAGLVIRERISCSVPARMEGCWSEQLASYAVLRPNVAQSSGLQERANAMESRSDVVATASCPKVAVLTCVLNVLERGLGCWPAFSCDL